MKCAACAEGAGPCAACAREEEVQRKEGSGDSGSADPASAGVRAIARAGVETAGDRLPHLDQVQASFGRHDLTFARAQVGGPAETASTRMGALAYTVGARVGFRSAPDVKLVAHEAAHLVQQRNGAKLPEGVGRPGDSYERQADDAADAVERGESAEPILDRARSTSTPSGARDPVVQHQLTANAVHVLEPPLLPVAPTTTGPATGPAGPAGRAARPGGDAASQRGRPPEGGAAAQADGGPAAGQPAPADANGGPSGGGGVESATTGGGFEPHCYHEPIEEPDDDTDDDPPPDPPTPQPEPDIHPDLPRVDESDICPVGDAIAQQAPTAAASATASSPVAVAGPQSPAQTRPAAGAPGAAPARAASAPGAARRQAGAAAGAPGTGGPLAASAAGSPAPATQESGDVGASPMAAAIENAEMGRAAAVERFTASAASMDQLASRVAALSSGARFSEVSGANREEQEHRQAADSQLSGFFEHASARLQQSITLVSEAVPDRFGSLAESIKSSLGSALEQQKSAVSGRVEGARAEAAVAAATAAAQVRVAHDAYVVSVRAETDSAIDELTTAHQETLGDVDDIETDSLAAINSLYEDGYETIVDLGPTYADRADERAEQYVDYYETCKIWEADGSPRKDGFFAGYLTNRRAEAQQKAARTTAQGYRDSLVHTANNQAAQQTLGRRHDRCGVIAAARSARTSIDDRLTTLVEALGSGRDQAIAQAGATRDGLIASIRSSLQSTLASLAREEHDDRQTLDDTGYLQQVAVEQAAFASATAVQGAVSGAVAAADSSLVAVRAMLASAASPTREDVDRSVAQAKLGLDAQMDLLVARVGDAVEGGGARLLEAQAGGIQALTGDGQSALDRISAASAGFATEMDSLASGAASTFAGLREQYAAQAQSTAGAGAEGFAQAAAGLQQACDTMLGNIEATLATAASNLEHNFQGQIAGLDDQERGIPKHADDAAAKEQPAWKSVVAVILIIAVIIVVAVVIGPAIIGAVGAAATALGASAGVATAVGAIVGGAIVGALSSGAMTLIQNWSTGQRWDTGLWRAMAIGAATGAIGGAIGLGVNSGLNALVGQGGRFALSQGAQFVVRGAVNVTSDALLNVGQQLAITGHIDWREFAEGMAVSLVLHGSRRLQAFQARVTARAAGVTASGVAAVTGEGAPSATRATRYADTLGEHAAQATQESRRPLDWTPPPPRASAGQTAPAAGAGEAPARPVEPTRTAPTEHTAAPRAAEPEPMAAPRAADHELARGAAPAAETEYAGGVSTPERLSGRPTDADGAVRRTEAEISAARSRSQQGPEPGADLERPAARLTDAELAETTTEPTRVGAEEHDVAFRRRNGRIECEVCSPACQRARAALDEVAKAVRRQGGSAADLNELQSLRDRIDSVEARLQENMPSISHRDLLRVSGEVADTLRRIGTRVQALGEVLMNPRLAGEGRAQRILEGTYEPRATGEAPGYDRIRVDNLEASAGTRVGETRRLVIGTDELESLQGTLNGTEDIIYVVRDRRTGAIAKVGETTGGTYEPTFKKYVRAARGIGLGGTEPTSPEGTRTPSQMEIEVNVVDLANVPEGTSRQEARMAIEAELRMRLEGEGHLLPWEQRHPAGRMGREGSGIPFEGPAGGSPARSRPGEPVRRPGAVGTEEAGWWPLREGGAPGIRADAPMVDQVAGAIRRLDAGGELSQQALADALGVSRRSVREWFGSESWRANLQAHGIDISSGWPPKVVK